MGIHQYNAEGDGFAPELFINDISLTSMGTEYLRVCHTMVSGGSSHSISVKVLIEHYAEKQAAGFAYVGTLQHEDDTSGNSVGEGKMLRKSSDLI